LAKAKIEPDRVTFLLERSYKPREYCVQYRETDYNFICRLMEEEGIWWTFEQTDLDHTLVIADSVNAYQPLSGDDATLPFRPPSGLNVNVENPEHIFRFRIGQS